MIIWVKKEAVGENCNQRAMIRYIEGINIYVRLLGNDNITIVQPHAVVGVKVDENLSIFFKYTGYSNKC